MGCDGLGGVAATMECPTSFNITGSGLQCRDHESRPDRAEGNLFVHASRPGRAYRRRVFSGAVEPIRLNLLGGTKTGNQFA